MTSPPKKTRSKPSAPAAPSALNEASAPTEPAHAASALALADALKLELRIESAELIRLKGWRGRCELVVDRRAQKRRKGRRSSVSYLWCAGLRAKGVSDQLTLAPARPHKSFPGSLPLGPIRTGDNFYDYRMRTGGSKAIAIAALDLGTRAQVLSLFRNGSAVLQGGQLSFWRFNEGAALLPAELEDDLSTAVELMSRWAELDIPNALLDRARVDPVLGVRHAAIHALALEAPAQLSLAVPAVHARIDDVLLEAGSKGDPKPMLELLAVPAVRDLLDARLDDPPVDLSLQLQRAFRKVPELAAVLGERALLVLLEGRELEGATQIELIRLLGPIASSNRALLALDPLREGFFRNAALKDAARAAFDQIAPRVALHAGKLSIATPEGALSLSHEGGAVSISVPTPED